MKKKSVPGSLNGVHVHFVGIKGTGMVALVEIFHHNGAVVTGSDVSERFYTDSIIENLGLKALPFSEKNITDEITALAGFAGSAVEKFNFISGSLGEVNTSIESVVHAMDDQERNGTSIWNMIKDVSNLTEEVKHSSGEMLAGGEKIISETSLLDELTRVLRENMDDIAVQAGLINDAAQESLEIAVKNKKSIDGLVIEVGKFKT